MNQLTSKQQIYNYLQKMSQHFQLDRFSNFTTITISKELSISRSLTSQYLNELVKDDLVVKISSRPVYYLSKNALEQIYHVVLKQNEYISIHELMQELKYSSPDLKDFQKSVGYDGSLSYPISQIKSALLYPDGLPIILYGERGTGKMYLVSCMKEFCQNHLNEKGHIVLDVKKVSLHEERTAQMEDLFGYEHNGEVKKGILENSDGKMLCIQDAQYLSDQAQEKIADFLRYGYFCREGNEYVRVQSKVRLVLCIENEPRISLNENLLINIPVICRIPSLQERSEDERTRLVVHFFQEEQERLKRKILISEKLCNFLVNHQFQGNISDLQKSIKAICANAFSETIHEEEMEVRIYHLPTHLLEQMSVDKYEKEEATFVRIDSFEKHELGEKMIQMWEQLLNAYEDLKNKVNSQARFLEIGQDVHIVGGDLSDAVNEGVRRGYDKGYLRKSVVKDPVRRGNTGDNTPAMIYTEIVPGEQIKITVGPKGFGSENMSAIRMFKPSHGLQGIKDFIIGNWTAGIWWKDNSNWLEH